VTRRRPSPVTTAIAQKWRARDHFLVPRVSDVCLIFLQHDSEGRRVVDRTDLAVVCEGCKQEIRWDPWRLFNVVLEDFPYSTSEAEKREGHCACKGKAYIQSRPPSTPIGAVKQSPRRR
jgi:hypothetical protein